MDNEMTLSFLAVSENERLARMVITSFIAELDPTIEELSEFKTIVSEAVSNAIIHGYDEDGKGMVTMHALRSGGAVTVTITDEGKGIENLEQAMEPLFTTKREMERSGMGFTIMESFSDSLHVDSEAFRGTTVRFTKNFQMANTAVM